MARSLCALLAVMLILVADLRSQHRTAGRHPRLVASPMEVQLMRAERGKYPLFAAAFQNARTLIDSALRRPLDVPVPKDAAGYTHERHKQNYREMQTAGMMYQLTGDERYASFVRDLLLQYAKLYPSLGLHPAAVGKSGGRLFWQTLNESVWLVNTSIAYDLVYEWLSPDDRARIEEGVLRPMAEFFIKDCASTVDRIHNHATWMTAGIGMLGYVLDDKRYIETALKGTKQSGDAGFLRQIDLLFSPDGYYSEGPYYSRYAIYPFFVFAESIERNQPELKVYERRGGVLGKAIEAILQLTTENGDIIQINDAMTKTVKAQELVLAVDYAFARYPNLQHLLSIAAEQGKVTFDAAGLAVAKALNGARPAPYAKRSVELSDGSNGDEGGIGVLRAGEQGSQAMLVLKYTAQGGGHGHFDRLNMLFFDEGRSVLTDYGAARFVNVEPKYGGRYLKENSSYAMQSVAHNTIIVDETSHYAANLEAGEKHPGQRRYVSTNDPSCQVVSAIAPDIANGVSVERTMALVTDAALTRPVVLDVLKVFAKRAHQLDLPFHYEGHLIHTNVRYEARTSSQKPVGKASGYQHLWETAGGESDSTISVTWLLSGRYYTVASAAAPKTKLLFVRTGANDPNFNLRSEPAFLLRRDTTTTVFASIIQPHGVFEPVDELSLGYRPPFNRVRVLFTSDEATVVEYSGDGAIQWRFAVSHGPSDEARSHTVRIGGETLTWTGNHSLIKN